MAVVKAVHRKCSTTDCDFQKLEVTAVSPNGRSTVSLVPEHGIVSGWKVDDWEVLYRPTESKNVARCGIPVLVPNFGALVDNKFVECGTTIEKHGFGRYLPWEKEETGAKNIVRMSITHNETTLEKYPFKFKFTVEAEVNDKEELLVRLTMENLESEKVLPVCPGFHPYIACHDSSKLECKISGIDGFSHDSWKWETVSDTPDNTYVFNKQAEVLIPSKKGKVIISELMASDGQKHLENIQVWSAPLDCEDTKFVCVEPIVAPPNGLNHEDQRLNIQPGSSLTIGTHYKIAKL